MDQGGLAGHIAGQSENTGQVVVSHEFPGPIELLTQAWEVTKSRFWALLGSMLITAIIGAILGALFIGPLVVGGIAAGLMGGSALELLTPFAILGFAGTMIVLIFVGIWQGIAMVEIIAGAGEKLSMGSAWKKAFSKIWGLIWVGLVSGAIFFGAAMPFFFPALIMMVWFSFGQFVYVTEGVGGLKALRISREYVRGKFWGVVGRQLFVILLYIAWGIVQAVFSLVLGKEIFSKIEWIFGLAGIPLGILVTVYQFMIYKNLKDIRGKIDPSQVEAGKTKWVLLGIWGLLGWLLIPVGAVILLLMINPAAKMQQARDIDTRFRLQGIQNNLLHYQTINGVYPSSLDDLVPEVTNRLPEGEFEYQVLNDGQDYELCSQDMDGVETCVNSQDEDTEKPSQEIFFESEGV